MAIEQVQIYANLCLKRTKIRLATRLCPDPLGEHMRSPRPTSCNGQWWGREGMRGVLFGIYKGKREEERGKVGIKEKGGRGEEDGYMLN